MASLKDIIAAKKAAAIKAEEPVKAVEPVVPSAPVEVEAKKAALTIMDYSAMSTEQLENITLGEVDNGILRDAIITVDDIVPRIRQLENLSDMEASREMDLLKAALMANPAAVSLMYPEDVGMLVRTLRRITNEAALASVAPKKAKKEKEPSIKLMTKEEISQIEDF